ncbi:hypothetical protein [Streptomyces sp. NPDC006134]|uniref:hypothetical protein n=1 Tax=Streptomyces sp. NPDC006134 TaxID=3154467 RepID=UPI0033E0A5DB
MRPKLPARTRSALAASGTVLASGALLAVLAPVAAAAQAPLPLPLPAAGPESLVTEGISIEGPLLNNINLPSLK